MQREMQGCARVIFFLFVGECGLLLIFFFSAFFLWITDFINILRDDVEQFCFLESVCHVKARFII